MNIYKRFFFILLVFLTAISAKQLPSEFKDNLIYLTPKLEDGKSVIFFTDTGGGWNAISRELQVKYEWKALEREADKTTIEVVDMPDFHEDAAIPKPGLNNWFQGQLQVVPKNKLIINDDIDGFLGGRWHAEKIIEFDYLEREISHLTELTASILEKPIELGF